MPGQDAPSPRARALVITPTYNEIDSLAATVGRLFDSIETVDVLVVDDASPDGTGDLADTLAADPRVQVLHRARKEGLGRAYLAGFDWAISRGYRVIVEMDADGSHPADALPAMLDVLDERPDVGLVIGSRWVAGGGVVDWPWTRKALSLGGNLYSRVMLRMGVRDITAGYRAYRAEVIDAIRGNAVDSRGYCFQVDMTVRTADAGWAIAEVPIMFRERTAGVSKMSGGIVIEAMIRVTAWGIAHPFRRRRPRYAVLP